MRPEMEVPVGTARTVLIESVAERGFDLAESHIPPRILAEAIAAYLSARKKAIEKLYGEGIGFAIDDEIRGLGGQ